MNTNETTIETPPSRQHGICDIATREWHDDLVYQGKERLSYVTSKGIPVRPIFSSDGHLSHFMTVQ